MWIRTLIVAGLAVSNIVAQEIRVALLPGEPVISTLKKIPVENADRSRYLMESFSNAGCRGERSRIAQAKGSKLPNIICELPGESVDEVIVVGAHYDKTKEGKGIVDNGSGAMLLPALYAALSKERRHHTIVFAGFTDEEKGLVGSRAFVKAIPKNERKRYRAMVNIDTLGLGPVTVWHSHANPVLIEWFERVAASLGRRDITYVNVGNVGDTDSSSFRGAGIPVIDFHSITGETIAVLHTKDDNESALREQDYLDSYRTIANYLAFVDLMLKQTPDLEKASKAAR